MNKQGVPLKFKIFLLVAAIFAISFLSMAYFIPFQGVVFMVFAYFSFGMAILFVFLTSILNYVLPIDDIISFETLAHKELQIYFNKVNKMLRVI